MHGRILIFNCHILMPSSFELSTFSTAFMPAIARFCSYQLSEFGNNGVVVGKDERWVVFGGTPEYWGQQKKAPNVQTPPKFPRHFLATGRQTSRVQAEMFINPVLAAARAELVRRRGALCCAALAGGGEPRRWRARGMGAGCASAAWNPGVGSRPKGCNACEGPWAGRRACVGPRG